MGGIVVDKLEWSWYVEIGNYRRRCFVDPMSQQGLKRLQQREVAQRQYRCDNRRWDDGDFNCHPQRISTSGQSEEIKKTKSVLVHCLHLATTGGRGCSVDIALL